MTDKQELFGHWTIDGPVMNADLEIGISLLGRTGFGETALLKLIGELRWRQLAGLCGVDSKGMIDAEGDRLYATFYFVDIQFPPGMSMASIGENDRLTIVNTIDYDGKSLIDGFHFLYPASWPDDKKVPLPDSESALALGIPVAHTSNAFVKMFQGAGWLKKSGPAVPGMVNVPTGPGGKETYRQIVAVGGGNRTWRMPDDTYDRLIDGQQTIEYVPDNDRDLNGLGLLYYANYPAVLDYAERRLIGEHGLFDIGSDLLDLRSTMRRQSAYLSNIVPPDQIGVTLDAWIENPFRTGADDPGAEPVRLFFNYEMIRRSDGRKMMVSTAEKTLHGRTVADAGLLDALRATAGR